jgi:aspartyl-tRNA(Asn)/glutamyl-tRNA(Gln) amidotransferase subunit C
MKVANLARIHLTEDELVPISGELSTMLNFMEQLNEVNVENIVPLTSVAPMELNLREDYVDDGGKQDEILFNAPEQSEGFFAVPKVIE